MLNWGHQRGHILIPKSNSIERQRENIESLNFSLTEEEVEEINKLDVGVRICDADRWLPGVSIFA